MELKFLDERLEEFKPATELSAGFDLRACIPENEFVELLPGATVKIKTGVALHMGSTGSSFDDGSDILYSAVIMPRSSLGCRGIRPRNVPGLIDADYQGEIIICLHNESEDYVKVAPMERIAQLVFIPVLHPILTIVDKFSNETERGEGGFGSTGKQ